MCVHLNGAVNVQSLSWLAEVDLHFNGSVVRKFTIVPPWWLMGDPADT